MKKLFSIALVAISISASAQTNWSLDKYHSKFNFTVSHMMVSDVDGTFKTIDCSLTSKNDKDLSGGSVTFTAETASVNTDNDKRDEHIKSEAFFDVAKNPTITFKSTSITKTKGNNYVIKGNLTFHGVTKAVVLNGTGIIGTNPMDKKTIAGFKVTGIVKRADYKVGTTIPTAVVGDDVSIVANFGFNKG